MSSPPCNCKFRDTALTIFDRHAQSISEIQEDVAEIQAAKRSLNNMQDTFSKELESIHQSLECLRSENQGNIQTCRESNNVIQGKVNELTFVKMIFRTFH
jgi:conjugal transfer/entry exclusion protein